MKRRDFLLSSAGLVSTAVARVAAGQSRPCPPPALSVGSQAKVTSSCSTDYVKFEPPITGEPQPEPFLMVDDDDTSQGGANFQFWNRRLKIPWKNEVTGDFLDATGTEQGRVAFSRMSFETVGQYNSGDVTSLVAKAVKTGMNRGIYLKIAGTDGPVLKIAGRLANAPSIKVVTTAGSFSAPVQYTANWFHPARQSLPRNSTDSFTISTSGFAACRFDLSSIRGEVVSATISFYLIERFGTNPEIEFFELNSPAFIVGAGELTPALGLAAQVGETNLGRHPDVFLAGHFRGTQIGSASSTTKSTVSPSLPGAEIRYQHNVDIVDDPDAPGTAYWRGQCVNVQPGSANRDPLQVWKRIMSADTSNPLFPVDTSTLLEEAYFRMYVLLEEDWLDRREGCKFGICWDLRLGIWDSASGWWSPQGGNSNHISDGRRHLGACHPVGNVSLGGSDYYSHPDYPRYCYKGHMQRQEPTLAGLPGQPYEDLYSLIGYNYSNVLYDPDAPSSHDAFSTEGGAWFLTGNVVQAKLRKGRWYCIEQHLRMNSIDLSVPDALGNGVANPDGLLETWLNGVLIDRISNLKWRCHPHMGIGKAGTLWYVGGNGTTNWKSPMHFRVSHFAFARQYIGPRVRP